MIMIMRLASFYSWGRGYIVRPRPPKASAGGRSNRQEAGGRGLAIALCACAYPIRCGCGLFGRISEFDMYWL